MSASSNILSMNRSEKVATAALAALFSARMLGLFMILPVFSIYGAELRGANAVLIGFAIGAYGLSQAALQIPFGLLSDRIGRKPVIYLGLIIFALGSFVAAYSDSIYGVILGRILQGAGAIASAVMALLADVTREEHRSKAMAALGMCIGLSFALALVLGPILTDLFSLSGLFVVTGVMALLGVVVCNRWVPTPLGNHVHRDTKAVRGQFKDVFSNPELMRLNFGILILHLTLTACFVVLPIILADHLAIAVQNHWTVYLPVLGASFVAMLPLMILAELKRMIKQVFVVAIAVLLTGLFALSETYTEFWPLCLALFIFFMAFNLLEAVLPSMISKLAPAGFKGTAMGVYSSCQFFGACLGGLLGGLAYSQGDVSLVFLACAGLVGVWLLLASSMRQPKFLQSHVLQVGKVKHDEAPSLIDSLMQVEGVAEAIVIAEEGAAYLKVDKKIFDPEQLARQLSQSQRQLSGTSAS